MAFFICWAPFHTQRLISIYSSPDEAQQSGLSPSTPVQTRLSKAAYVHLLQSRQGSASGSSPSTPVQTRLSKAPRPVKRCKPCCSTRQAFSTTLVPSSTRYSTTSCRSSSDAHSRRPCVAAVAPISAAAAAAAAGMLRSSRRVECKRPLVERRDCAHAGRWLTGSMVTDTSRCCAWTAATSACICAVLRQAAVPCRHRHQHQPSSSTDQ